MNREDFDLLVRRVEAGVGRDHAALRRRAVRLAVLGYLVLLAWFIVVVLIAAAFLAAAFWADPEGRVVCIVAGLFVLGFGGWASLRVLLVPAPAPQGRALTRAEAPALFAELDALRSRLRSAPFHRVLLTPEFNAGVVQSPRLGPLGWSRNHLCLGLPLLDALSPDEMRAVIAHECAHLSRAHGRTSHWIYRLRRSWERYFQIFAAPRAAGEISTRPLTVKFIDWFWPRFNAHAFVLSRADEYEADAHAARLVGGAHLASALVRSKTLGRLLDDKLWPALWRLSHADPAPPSDLFARLRDGLRAGAAPDDAARWLAEAFQTASTNSDTHPCLNERLHALGLSSRDVSASVRAASPSAAEALLGSAREPLRHAVHEAWLTEAAPGWREQHARASAHTDRLASIGRIAPASAIADVEALWDKAHALLQLDDRAAVEPALRAILARRADHAAANFHLGRLLLDDGRPEGETHLERAMADDEDLVPQACDLLHAYHRRLGRADRLHELSLRVDRHEKETAAARAERSELTAKDILLAHDLPADELVALRRILDAEPELARAALAQKELRHFKKQRLFLLCVRRRRAWHRLPDSDADRTLVRRLSQAIRLPGRLLVFTPSGSFRGIGRKLLARADAVIRS